MKMYRALQSYLDNSGLLTGVTVQYLQWTDKGKDKTYVVFRPNGGSILSDALTNTHLVLVDFIGPDNDPESIDDLVHDVAKYIMSNQIDECLGNVQIVGNIPSPVTTEDNRLVYRLLVSITHRC